MRTLVYTELENENEDCFAVAVVPHLAIVMLLQSFSHVRPSLRPVHLSVLSKRCDRKKKDAWLTHCLHNVCDAVLRTRI